jgi:hypothetical protein
MKNKTLFFSFFLFMASGGINAQLIEGSCAPYIEVNDYYSLQADSIYLINKTAAKISVDAVAESAWAAAYPRVLSKVGRENASQTVNLDNYPQTEAYGHATYRALWTEEGVYMFITLKDEYVRYQNPHAQWENDAIEFFFAKERGAGFKQIIIPAMVGTTNQNLIEGVPMFPAPLEYESGSAAGSHAKYLVHGYDANNWDPTLFNWAIKKTAVGFDMEVYMDKDIVTNGNSLTNYGLNKVFAGEIAYDVAGLRQNSNDPALYVREGILNMLSNSNGGWARSSEYGYFKMVEDNTGIDIAQDLKFEAIYNSESKEIRFLSGSSISSVVVYTLAGQVVPTHYSNSKVSVSNLNKGIYMVKVIDLAGNELGVQKVVLY